MPAKEQDRCCMKDEALTPLKTTVKHFRTLVRLEFYNSFSEKNTLILQGNFNNGNEAGLALFFSSSDQTMTDLCLLLQIQQPTSLPA